MTWRTYLNDQRDEFPGEYWRYVITAWAWYDDRLPALTRDEVQWLYADLKDERAKNKEWLDRFPPDSPGVLVYRAAQIADVEQAIDRVGAALGEAPLYAAPADGTG